MAKPTQTTEVVETITEVATPTYVALRPALVPSLRKSHLNGFAADVLNRFCKTNHEGMFVLPSGADERKIIATLVLEGITNPVISKVIANIFAGKGMRAFLAEYTNTTGLFSSKKAMLEYISRKEDLENTSELPTCEVFVIDATPVAE